ncbi:hypothetical protein EIL87_04535 [Saccharopolyspora rhizosphaerae]|uniref:YwqJ-like deaminase n=1 Tax=Saccharopolyspora rhizosphaerae TaxID=2492662 RepID=A0A3R8P3P3_9PSEU|nr:YwqJ-related putative deaminase [Saccharopolyspora rhizosphaerae]RRO19372.1 hypothetical protein EIL87_04535 [Saccharopolyspora rhizosphaerae]
MGPDGRPGWPPNGGWDTHHPDGTRTPASNDGFHPTRDGEDAGQQPDGSEASRKDGLSEEDRRQRQEALVDELNSLPRDKAQAIFDRYYRQDSNGVVYRRDGYANDPNLWHQGATVPPLRLGSDGRFSINEGQRELTARADYVGEPRRQSGPLPQEWAQTADDLARGRPGIQQSTMEAAESAKGNPDPNSRWTESGGQPLDDIDRSGFNHARSVTGEALGDLAQTHFFSELEQRGYRFDDERIATGNAGHFDGFRRGIDPDGNSVYVVTEAKGPSAGLGARQGFEQGTPEYFKSVLDAMDKRGGHEAVIARELSDALGDGRVEYHLVQANVEPVGTNSTDAPSSGTSVPHERYSGYTEKQFDLNPDRPLHEPPSSRPDADGPEAPPENAEARGGAPDEDTGTAEHEQRDGAEAQEPSDYKPPAAEGPAAHPVDFSHTPLEDPGATPDFSESGPSDRTRGSAVESLPEDRVKRNDNGLIAEVKDAEGNFVPIHDYVQQLSQERAEAIAPGTHKKEGPCSAVAIDLQTGLITEGVNGRPNDVLKPENVHPLLRENLESLGQWQYPVRESETTLATNHDGEAVVLDGQPHFDKPLRHAEVKAVNELLWARERSGDPLTREALEQLRIDPRWVRDGRNMAVGQEAPACANCDSVLRGVPSYTGRFSYNPFDYRYPDKHSVENDNGLRRDSEDSGG